MNSLILSTATRILVSLMLVFSLFMLLRGHNEPGGGFGGGLLAATGFALYAMVHGTAAARRALRLDPRLIAMVGVAIGLLSGIAAAVAGDPLFTVLWWFIDTGSGDKGLPLSTALLFDIGVYLTVIGSMLTFVFALGEED